MIHILILLSKPLYSLVDPLYLEYISICGSYYSDAKSGPDLTINDINYEETYVSNSTCDLIDQNIRIRNNIGDEHIEHSGAVAEPRKLRF